MTLAAVVLWAFLLPPLCVAADGDQASSQGEVFAVRIADAITPVNARFIVATLEQANVANARAFLLEIDTPGGLDTAMRTVIQGILGSRVPVIVYVFPAGARAASAGALITLAADVAAMAPGTNIGAAHPVAIGPSGGGEGQDETMKEKVVNDSVAYARSIAEKRGRNADWAERMVRESLSISAEQALEQKIIDLVAESEQALLEGVHGRRYLREGKELFLDTEGARLHLAEMSLRQKVLTTISNPNVAYMLLMLGILGIFFEISQPGVILPGAIGALALLLAFFALQTLPVNYVGVLLILLAIVLFILEVKVVSYGMLTVGGMLSLTFGSLMLIDSPAPYLQISRSLVAVTVGVTSILFVAVLYFVVRTQKRQPVSGAEGMAGERGVARTEVHADGRVYVHGEYWDAFADEPIVAGEAIEVVRMAENMRLEVKRIDNEQPLNAGR